MEQKKYKIALRITGSETEINQKANALAVLGSYLSGKELEALAKFLKSGDPNQVALAKNYLGL